MPGVLELFPQTGLLELRALGDDKTSLHWPTCTGVNVVGDRGCGKPGLGNLVLLCGLHHRLVHEGKWRIELDADGGPVFTGPDGRVRAHGPPPLRDEVREQLIGRDTVPAPPRDAG